MRILRPLAALAFVFALIAPASASILIEIDKSSQRMTVSQDGQQLYNWPVSTGAPGYDTPSGSFKPFRMEKDHFSREWDDAPMPNSIFFTQRGHAIHGTEHTRNIGRPASHGCVRLQPQNARLLFGLVKQAGMANTRVVLTGATPTSGPAMARSAPSYDETGSIDTPRVTRGDNRPVYWGSSRPARPSDFYDDGPGYRQAPPPPPGFYFGPRPGWN